MDPIDISRLLTEWPYEEEGTIRRIRGADGRDKLQVRLPLGIEQYEIDGRPDGLKPEGYESYLDYYRAIAEAEGPGWELTSDAFSRLYEEGLLYYCRYLLFFRIGEYDLCARDTTRNMDMADFVTRWAGGEAMIEAVMQYRPYIIRMRAVSLAVKVAKEGRAGDALKMLAEAIAQIEILSPVDTQVFRLEKARSLVALRDLLTQFRRQQKAGVTVCFEEESCARPSDRTSDIERLKNDLARAVSEEDYERAARIRDRIQRLAVEKDGAEQEV